MKRKIKNHVVELIICPECNNEFEFPVIKDAWMQCPYCSVPKSRNWLEKVTRLSDWIRTFAWLPRQVQDYKIWLEWYEEIRSVTFIRSSAGGFDMGDVKFRRLIAND